MIPRAFITEWSQHVPWQTNEQVEQDLLISRALVEIFSDKWLADSLAFRGGTALHKLFSDPQPRYSEDIDLVQIRSEPIKETITRLQSALGFLGSSAVDIREHSTRVVFRFDSEFVPVVSLKLKVEINTREHFTILGLRKLPYEVKSSYFAGKCELSSYFLEELLGTKLRALYQRKKGRDLFDLYLTIMHKPLLDINSLLLCYKKYMQFSVGNMPSKGEFLINLEAKLLDSEFLGDTTALLRPDVFYNPNDAFELVKTKLISRL